MNINILDKISQLQDLVGVIDLEYFRNFYFSHKEAHIFNLNLYDVVGVKYKEYNNHIFSLCIGCCYIYDDEGPYHIFLSFDVFFPKYYIIGNTTKNIKTMLNSHEIIVDHEYNINLNNIDHKILENDITGYKHHLNYIKKLLERIEKIIITLFQTDKEI